MKRAWLLAALALASCGQAPGPLPAAPFGPLAPPVIAPYLPAPPNSAPARRAQLDEALDRLRDAVRALRDANDNAAADSGR